MRMSDWSSDVCSSDLGGEGRLDPRDFAAERHRTGVRQIKWEQASWLVLEAHGDPSCGGRPTERRTEQKLSWSPPMLVKAGRRQIGRASWRVRVCQYG